MKSRQAILNALILIVALSPIAYLFFVWDSLPEKILLRFSFEQPTDVEQSRDEFLWSSILISIAAATIYLLMRNLRRIDPKVKRDSPTSGFNKLGLSVMVFLVLLNYFYILSAVNSWEISSKVAFLFGGLLMAVLGNYMNNIKPNFFAGIRLPWTLNDEDNWRQTHHLTANLWFWGGIFLALIALILPEAFLKPFFISVMVLLVLIPGVYTYLLFKNKIKS
jgi:uncharacterized membrane protein